MALFQRIQLKLILVLFIVLLINCINCENICDNCLEKSQFENSFRIKRSDSSTESVISDQNQSDSKSNSTNFANNRFVF
jgi:hypothetical protein